MKLQELNLNEMMSIDGGTVCPPPKPSYTKITKIIVSRNNTAIGNAGVVVQNSGDITLFF
ncbi:MAG: hypothetical protein JWR76_1477 [Mucilaginibacter sp.]|jgi:hypothetical protein|nr:hypothetical protein [Mucilaginibacter sp.]